MQIRSLLLGFGVCFSTFITSACDNSCVKLSHKICQCERTTSEQQACIQRVDNQAATRDATEEEQNECARLEDECTCKKLAAGDLAACGLAN